MDVPPSSSNNARSHILLCESYPALVEAIQLVLGDRYPITHTSSLTEFPPLVTLLKPALLIIDADNQVGDIRVLKDVKPFCNNLPILWLSGEWSLDQQLEAIQIWSYSRFLQKPFSPDVLLEKVDTLIRGYSLSPIRTRVIRIPTSG